MKYVLILFAFFAVIQNDAWAKCKGDDIGTDYWGRTYGCACNGGGVDEQKSRGNEILSKNAGYKFVCTGCGFWCNDRWEEKSGGFCSGTSQNSIGSLVLEMNESRRCWEYRCPSGSYLEGSADGVINREKCIPCNGLGQTVSDGICWNVLCGSKQSTESEITRNKNFGKEVVIYNGKCMPICDLQTSGATYDGDGSYIGIKIKKANAGNIGEANN